MSLASRAMLAAALAVGALAAGAGRAAAYPQFQLSTGAPRCNLCHFAPTGGGLLNSYGRDESADTVSRGGNGGFLHGLWEPPPWLALGGDFRGATLVNDVGSTEGAELLYFPMQVDLYVRGAYKAFSLNVVAGARGRARPRDQPLSSLAISREHYLMWRPSGTGPYVRVGRFFPTYGLRLQDHTAYVRRYLGLHTLEEVMGVSGGYLTDGWEVHATAFIPPPIWAGTQVGSGGAVYFEKRFGETKAAGAQTRLDVTDVDTRVQGGAIGKWWLGGPGVMLMGEADVVRQSFAADGLPGRTQLATYLGATWWATRGVLASCSLERWDEDLSVKDVARDSIGATVQYFPRAHIEVQLLGRYQLYGGGDGGDPARQLMLQLHYYL